MLAALGLHGSLRLLRLLLERSELYKTAFLVSDVRVYSGCDHWKWSSGVYSGYICGESNVASTPVCRNDAWWTANVNFRGKALVILLHCDKSCLSLLGGEFSWLSDGYFLVLMGA